MAKRKKRNNAYRFLISSLVNNLVFGRAKIEASKRKAHVCPIYRAKLSTEPELIATGIFFSIGDRKFVLTASHVFGSSDEGHQYLYIPSHRTRDLTELVGTYIRSTKDKSADANDTNDIGIVLLHEELAAQIESSAFVTMDMVDVYDIGDFTKPYMAMGFPWRVSPKVCRRSRTATASIFSYLSELLGHEKLLKRGLSSRTHFLLRYAKRHSRDHTGRDITVPDPHGLSGGPLWRIEPLNSDGETSRLVGIVIEWDREEGGLLAFRLPLILAGIGQICPEIAHLIPESETVAVKITTPLLIS